MRVLTISAAAVLFSAIAAAHQTTVSHAPFQGSYVYGFETANAMQMQTCLQTSVGHLCSTSGHQFIVSYNLISPYCTRYPHSGTQMAAGFGMPPSMSLEFPEPMQRFGMWYVHTGQYMSVVEVRFFDEYDNMIDVQQADLPPCPWTWIGWQALDGAGFSRVEMIQYGDDCSALGMDVCTTEPNSTGRTGRMSVQGSDLASCSALLLQASDLPARVPATFLLSNSLDTSAFRDGLCLGEPLLHVPSVLVTDHVGGMSAVVDTDSLPILSGETWGFQAWHREPGGTHGLTDTVAVTFH